MRMTYKANCIEHGEQFYTLFQTSKDLSPEKLLQAGKDLASGWGGECMSVE